MKKSNKLLLTVLCSLAACGISACGSSGQQGEQGAPGAKGDGCTIVTNEDGTATIKCTDGQTFDIVNGEKGDSCKIVTGANGNGSVVCTDGSSFNLKADDDGNAKDAKVCTDGFYGPNCESSCFISENLFEYYIDKVSGLYCLGMGTCDDGVNGKGCVCNVDSLNSDCSPIKQEFGTVTFGDVEYKTIKIGSKIWLAENLRLMPGQDKELGTDYFYPNGDESNVDAYGYLYTYKTALEICPAGWHLPSADDFDELYNLTLFAGNGDPVLSLITNSDNWGDFSNKGLDEFGFGALPAGGHNEAGYYSFEEYGYYWTATEYTTSSSSSYGLSVTIGYYNEVSGGNSDARHGNSVRCIKDEG